MVTITNGVSLPANSAAATVQVRVRRRCIVGGYSGGTLMWVTPERAKQLKALNAIDIVGDDTPAPSPAPLPPEATVIGNAQANAVPAASGVLDPKSFDAPTSGPTIGSASLSGSGQGEQSSASVAAPAPTPPVSLTESERHASAMSAGSSSLTTPISSTQTPTSSTLPTQDGGNGTERSQNSRRSRG